MWVLIYSLLLISGFDLDILGVDCLKGDRHVILVVHKVAGPFTSSCSSVLQSSLIRIRVRSWDQCSGVRPEALGLLQRLVQILVTGLCLLYGHQVLVRVLQVLRGFWPLDLDDVEVAIMDWLLDGASLLIEWLKLSLAWLALIQWIQWVIIVLLSVIKLLFRVELQLNLRVDQAFFRDFALEGGPQELLRPHLGSRLIGIRVIWYHTIMILLFKVIRNHQLLLAIHIIVDL